MIYRRTKYFTQAKRLNIIQPSKLAGNSQVLINIQTASDYEQHMCRCYAGDDDDVVVDAK